MSIWGFVLAMVAGMWPALAWASEESGSQSLDLTGHWVGIGALVIFALAYASVMLEEKLHLRKSIPVIVAAGLIWLLIGGIYAQHGDVHTAEAAVRHNILEYGELFLFLLAAMTFINTMDERGVFNALRAWLVGRGYSYRQLFWVTGALAFFISPVADNLTTALLMGAVLLAVAKGRPEVVGPGCINLVVAANAGGAFSPFGDITTLMVWQKGNVSFFEFFALFIPSLMNWLVPAFIMSLAIPKEQPAALDEAVIMKPGARVVIGLFAGTIALAVCFHNFFHLPPVLGMMTGLGALKLFSYFRSHDKQMVPVDEPDDVFAEPTDLPERKFDVFKQLERAEWDTLMFFYGVILCVGGLGTIGYLAVTSQFIYGDLGATTANILIGIISAIVDNIPVMFAVLAMQPDMSHGQWLLVTLTAGVGGSLLSIGSAAGVALMGQARGIYTFLTHLKWTWAIALGYAASIGVHFLINRHLF